MNTVVDTNVVAYYLLGTQPFLEEAQQYWRAVREAWAPIHWEVELANTIWMAVRAGVLQRNEGHLKLDIAAQLGVRTVPIRALWQPALATSLVSGISVYDTLFVELAAQQKLKLATFDEGLLKKFPAIAVRPRTLSSN